MLWQPRVHEIVRWGERERRWDCCIIPWALGNGLTDAGWAVCIDFFSLMGGGVFEMLDGLVG